MTFQDILTMILNGLSQGGVYALIALGYTMVYGIAKMLNFAHGDIIMVGGYAIYVVIAEFSMPLLAISFAVVFCAIIGILMEKLAYKPLRSASPLAVLITAIGVSYFLQNAALLIWTSNTKVFPNVFANLPAIQLGGTQIAPVTLITVLANIVIMLALTFFTSKTKMGKAMRAVSEDKGAATLMGINVNRTISMTFAIGSGLAAIAGVLLCSAYPTLMPTTGAMPGIKAFTAAVFGGIGSIPGAMLGGLTIGMAEVIVNALGYTTWADAVVYVILILVLLIKPTGFLGRTMREKV